MKRILTLLAALGCALCLISSCKKTDVWVTYKATVDGNVTLEALAVQTVMNARIEEALGPSTYGNYLESTAHDQAAIKACDSVFAETGHGASAPFTILLNRSYPNSDPGNIKSVTLKTYQFTTGK